jgi:beta-phosphoglucomutase-like phosphatase (HAD superfamily)
MAGCEALHAVMFDMDGLLVDTEPLWFEVEGAVMARLGGSWSQADQAQLIGGSLHASVGYLLAKAAPPHRAAAAGDGRGPFAPSAPTAAAVADWLLDGMVAAIAAHGVPLLPGAAELLAEIASAGLPCALVTSSERMIMDAVLHQLAPALAEVTGRAATGRAGPAGHRSVVEHIPVGGAVVEGSLFERTGFHATVCAADVSRTKPDPEPYLLAARLLGADPARCVVLEDAPNGIAAAEAAGCRVVAVPGMVPVAPAAGRVIARSLREVSLPMLCALAAGLPPSARRRGQAS